MISSLQPTRPKITASPFTSPLSQQQQRKYTPTPRSQIEAMPPHQAPSERQAAPMPPTAFNPALVHPVFFTNSWRKPPFTMPTANGFSPVATGYVFTDSKRREQMTKL